MLMILGLFGALMAGAAADTMLSARGQDADDEPPPDTEPQDDALARDFSALTYAAPDQGAADMTQVLVPHETAADVVHSSDIFAFFPVDDDPADLPAADPAPPAALPVSDPHVPAHETAPERIHSSDLFAPPPAPAPLVADLSEQGGRLDGGALGDRLTSAAGSGILAGHGGDDWLQGGQGALHLIGGEGHDTLVGGSGDDSLDGGEGDDVLIAGLGSNVLMGGQGHDILLGAIFDSTGTDLSGQNFLNGGAGQDTLIAGGGDYLNGGDDPDVFALGDWLGGNAATIVDYVPGEDQILLQFDPARVGDPSLDIRFDADAPSTAQIWLNDQIVAQVLNGQGLTLSDIALVPVTEPALLAGAQQGRAA